MRVLICSSCADARDLPAERQAVLDALRATGLDRQVEIAEHACFSGCNEPTVVAMQGESLASYVFSGIDPVADADDIAATCRTILNSPNGWIEDARPCGRLRLCLRARIPAFQST